MAHYYACKFGLNRLRINGDIRQKAALAAILENVVIAVYRLGPIQPGIVVQRYSLLLCLPWPTLPASLPTVNSVTIFL